MQENDPVERQAVIDDIDEWIDIYGENKCVDAQDILKQAKRSIKKLPSAQPKRTIKRTETRACDCISREAAIDGVKTLHDVAWKNWHEPTLSANIVLDMIRELPSAQPKRKNGEWTLVTDNNGQHFVCDQCGEWRYHQEQRFCGECGADMRGECNEQ